MGEDDRKRARDAEIAETEALLAGFDRPGRTPRAPPAKRDFIAHHAGDRGAEPRRDRPTQERPKLGATFIIPRRKPPPRWLPIAIAVAVMPLLGGLLVFAFVRPAAPAKPPPSSAASSATTTMASVPAKAAPPQSAPPVEPSGPETAPARPTSTSSAPKNAASADPRGDFMRKL